MYTCLATVVFFFTGATVSAQPALSVLFVCCQLSCFYLKLFYEQIKMMMKELKEDRIIRVRLQSHQIHPTVLQ